MALLHGRAGDLTAANGGLRPGQDELAAAAERIELDATGAAARLAGELTNERAAVAARRAADREEALALIANAEQGVEVASAVARNGLLDMQDSASVDFADVRSQLAQQADDTLAMHDAAQAALAAGVGELAVGWSAMVAQGDAAAASAVASLKDYIETHAVVPLAKLETQVRIRMGTIEVRSEEIVEALQELSDHHESEGGPAERIEQLQVGAAPSRRDDRRVAPASWGRKSTPRASGECVAAARSTDPGAGLQGEQNELQTELVLLQAAFGALTEETKTLAYSARLAGGVL
jgi:hypothetical protein